MVDFVRKKVVLLHDIEAFVPLQVRHFWPSYYIYLRF